MKYIARNDPFVCGHCGKSVDPIKYGGSYRNHCPFCLWSKHMDGEIPGDRANSCQGLMEPVGVELKGGEYTILHRCVLCGFEKRNKMAKDDNFDVVLQLSSRQINR
mgnify:CR=1 FL=1